MSSLRDRGRGGTRKKSRIYPCRVTCSSHVKYRIKKEIGKGNSRWGLYLMSLENVDNPCEVIHLKTVEITNDSMSYADLNMIYENLYNFTMCAYCRMPSEDMCCSDSCYEMYAAEA